MLLRHAFLPGPRSAMRRRFTVALVPPLLGAVAGSMSDRGSTHPGSWSFASLRDASADSAAAALRVVADSFLAASRGAGPSRAWADYSDASRRDAEVRMDRIAAMLASPVIQRVSAPADRLLRDNLVETVSSARAARACRRELWASIGPLAGWHVAAANWAKPYVSGTVPLSSAAVARLAELQHTMQAHQQLLQRGLDSGFTTSIPVVDAVAQQLRILFPDSVAASPMVGRLAASPGDSLAGRWTAVVRDTLLPAVRAYQAFLTGPYRAGARVDGSVSTLPAGPACYAAWLREQTSVAVDLEARSAEARLAFAAALRDMAPLVQRLTGDTNVVQGIRTLRTGGAFAFESRDATLAAYRALNALAASRVSRVIRGVTPESLAVNAYGEAEEKADLPPRYLPARGEHVAQFLVNLARRDRMSAPDAVAHEGYPGHHLQSIAAKQATPIHPAMQSMFFGSFVEGWGIYAEELGDEMGLYADDLSRAGYLIHLADVLMAFYLDVGFHHRGWTRAMLVDSMMTMAGRARGNAEAYADRHASTPGQLATYYIGWRTFRAARANAARVLGTQFDVREFHHEALRDGGMALASLERRMADWVTAQRRPLPPT